jgi:phosphopantetheinyl transferase (holo-ACP synthase)
VSPARAVVHVVVAPLPPSPARGRERVELRSRVAREAVRESARLAGAELGALAKDADDVPLPSNGWRWSLSHAASSVAGAVARAAIGIDVEELREVRDEVVARVLSDDEAARLGSRGALAFLRAWTAKEARLKELGIGLAGGLDRCRIVGAGEDELVVELDGELRRVRQLVERARVVSISVGGDAPVEFVVAREPRAAAPAP